MQDCSAEKWPDVPIFHRTKLTSHVGFLCERKKQDRAFLYDALAECRPSMGWPGASPSNFPPILGAHIESRSQTAHGQRTHILEACEAQILCMHGEQGGEVPALVPALGSPVIPQQSRERENWNSNHPSQAETPCLASAKSTGSGDSGEKKSARFGEVLAE